MTLSELAKTIRSKNAGVDRITFDVIFEDECGLPARASQLAYFRTKQFVACSASLLIGSPTGWSSIPRRAIKFTIRRTLPERQPRRR